MKNAEQRIGSASRVGERAEDVEDGAYAHLAAHRGNIFHGRMVIRGEHETDPRRRQAFADLRWLEHDVRTKRFEHIGAARAGRHAAIAVLGHFGARSRGNKHRCRRNIEGMRTVAACADDIDKARIVGHFDARRQLAHHLRSGGDLTNGFFFDAQASKNRCGHHRRNLALHDLAHQRNHFVVEDFAVLDDPQQSVLWLHLACSSRKFFSMS